MAKQEDDLMRLDSHSYDVFTGAQSKHLKDNPQFKGHVVVGAKVEFFSNGDTTIIQTYAPKESLKTINIYIKKDVLREDVEITTRVSASVYDSNEIKEEAS